MNLPISITQNDLSEILLHVATVRPVFIWGAPGIGKSALVEKFANDVGLPCVSLLGSQLAPEDIIGIPQIKGDTSEFLPPKMIARNVPCLHQAAWKQESDCGYYQRGSKMACKS